MTRLELVAEIGNGAIRVTWMYLERQLTLRELEDILGKRRAGLTRRYVNEYIKECVIQGFICYNGTEEQDGKEKAV